MTKALIVDFYNYDEHRSMNAMLIEGFAACAEVDVLSLNGYYAQEKQRFEASGVTCIEVEKPIKRTGRLSSRTASLKIMKIAAGIARRKRYDIVVSLAFDTVAFAFGRFRFGRVPVALLHHLNIDELSNAIKRKLFRTYQNKVYHLVFEDRFAGHLVRQTGIGRQKVFVIPHPVKPSDPAARKAELKYDCVGLCQANAPETIEDLIAMNDVLRKNDIRILMRSRTIQKELSNITVISGYISRQEYDDYISAGKYFFLAMPASYRNRISGSFLDAIAMGKTVLTANEYFAAAYRQKYPGICYDVKGAEALVEFLKAPAEDEAKEESLKSFTADHSMSAVREKIREAIGGMTRGS